MYNKTSWSKQVSMSGTELQENNDFCLHLYFLYTMYPSGVSNRIRDPKRDYKAQSAEAVKYTDCISAEG